MILQVFSNLCKVQAQLDVIFARVSSVNVTLDLDSCAPCGDSISVTTVVVTNGKKLVRHCCLDGEINMDCYLCSMEDDELPSADGMAVRCNLPSAQRHDRVLHL